MQGRSVAMGLRGNGFKLKEGQFRLDIRKNVFYEEGGKTSWNRLPMEVPHPGNFQGQFG